jgi:hypothetical protein
MENRGGVRDDEMTIFGVTNSELMDMLDASFNAHRDPLPYRAYITAAITTKRKKKITTSDLSESGQAELDRNFEGDEGDAEDGLESLEAALEYESDNVALRVVEEVFAFLKNGTGDDPRIYYQINLYCDDEDQVGVCLSVCFACITTDCAHTGLRTTG